MVSLQKKKASLPKLFGAKRKIFSNPLFLSLADCFSIFIYPSMFSVRTRCLGCNAVSVFNHNFLDLKTPYSNLRKRDFSSWSWWFITNTRWSTNCIKASTSVKCNTSFMLFIMFFLTHHFFYISVKFNSLLLKKFLCLQSPLKREIPENNIFMIKKIF